MYMLQVTITTSDEAQPIIPENAGVRNSHTRFQSMVPQYNGTNILYLGDAAVSPTNSLQFAPGGSLGGAQAFNGPGNLLDFYVYGTSGDILNILVID